MLINLSSDTVTKPTEGMLQAMMSAEVGDDVFKQDPSINALEAHAAKLFGMDDALFCPSGTMTNQIAIKVHTKALDEMICHELSHVYLYELGGYAYNSRIGVHLLSGADGKITASQVEAAIKPKADWMPISSLVVLENTANKAGGSYYTLEEVTPISKLCQERGIALHLDGARLFNALVESGEDTLDVGSAFDSISICLSKGLGAPVGSLLIGNKDFISEARRFRKAMGGGMRQAGYLAAAGLYALEHHVERLKSDHDHARRIGHTLDSLNWVTNIRPVRTNIVIFDLAENIETSDFLSYLRDQNILTIAMGPKTIRLVFHLDVSSAMVEQLDDALNAYSPH